MTCKVASLRGGVTPIMPMILMGIARSQLPNCWPDAIVAFFGAYACVGLMRTAALPELRNRGADRRERSIFVLQLAELVEVGTIRRIHWLRQQVGKVVRETGAVRPRLRLHISGNVPRLLDAEPHIEIIGAVRHVEVDEIGERDDARHAGAVVERARAPKRRIEVAEIGASSAAADARSIGVVAGGTDARENRLAAFGIGGAAELGHMTGAKPGQSFAGRHATGEEFDVGDDGLHL